MDFSAAAASFSEHGFVVVRGLFDEAEAEALETHVIGYFAEAVPSRGAESVFYDVEGDASSLKYINHPGHREAEGGGLEGGEAAAYLGNLDEEPRMLALAQALLGLEDGELAPRGERGRGEFFAKAPGVSKPTPPHQDNFYFSWKPASVVTFWLAVDPIDEENGCLRYMSQEIASGKHANGKQGLLPHHASHVKGFSQRLQEFSDADAALMQPQVLRPGDLVAHHGLTIHRADANTSHESAGGARPRRAFGCVYHAAECVVDEEGRANYVRSMSEQGLPGGGYAYELTNITLG